MLNSSAFRVSQACGGLLCLGSAVYRKKKRKLKHHSLSKKPSVNLELQKGYVRMQCPGNSSGDKV